MWYNQGMVVTVFYKDGCIYAEDCDSFKLEKTIFFLNREKNDLDDSIDKIFINGDVVYEFKPFEGFNESLYRYMVSCWKKSGKQIVNRRLVKFSCAHQSPRTPMDYPFSCTVDGKEENWCVPKSIFMYQYNLDER